MSRRVTAYVVDPSLQMLETAAMSAANTPMPHSKADLVRRFVVDQLANRYLWSRKTDIASAYLGATCVHKAELPSEESLDDCDTNLGDSAIKKAADSSSGLFAFIHSAGQDLKNEQHSPAWKRQITIISARLNVENDELDAIKQFLAASPSVDVQWVWMGEVPESVQHMFSEESWTKFADISGTLGETRPRRVAPISNGTTLLIMRDSADPTVPNLLEVSCATFPATRGAIVPLPSTIARFDENECPPEDESAGVIDDNETKTGSDYDSADKQSRFVLVNRDSVYYYLDQNQERHPVAKELVTPGYVYGSEIIPAGGEVDALMHENAPEQPHAPQESNVGRMEILAFMPTVPPWLKLGFSDFVVADPKAEKAKAAALLVGGFAKALHSRNEVAICRFRSNKPRPGTEGLGRYDPEICVLEPFFETEDDNFPCLLRTRLPFAQEYHEWYKNVAALDIPSTPEAELQASKDDSAMEAVVNEMILMDTPENRTDEGYLPETEYIDPLADTTSRFLKSRVIPYEEYRMPWKPWTPPGARPVEAKVVSALAEDLDIHKEMKSERSQETQDDVVLDGVDLSSVFA